MFLRLILRISLTNSMLNRVREDKVSVPEDPKGLIFIGLFKCLLSLFTIVVFSSELSFNKQLYPLKPLHT